VVPGGSTASRTGSSALQEVVLRYPGLPEDAAQRAFRHIAGVIGNGRVAGDAGIELDLMRSGGLPAEFKTDPLQALDDLPITEAGQSAHQAFTING
jgi:hypothetical protein